MIWEHSHQDEGGSQFRVQHEWCIAWILWILALHISKRGFDGTVKNTYKIIQYLCMYLQYLFVYSYTQRYTWDSRRKWTWNDIGDWHWGILNGLRAIMFSMLGLACCTKENVPCHLAGSQSLISMYGIEWRGDCGPSFTRFSIFCRVFYQEGFNFGRAVLWAW